MQGLSLGAGPVYFMQGPVRLVRGCFIRLFCLCVNLPISLVADPPPIRCRMMVKSHVVGLIEALRGHYPEYEEKLLEDLTQLDLPEEPPAKRTTRKVTKQAAAMKKLTKQKKPEGTIPDMIPQLSLRGQAQAVEYNLGDMEQVARLNQYLARNAFLELFPDPQKWAVSFCQCEKGV